jgi:glycosyltransferase involved in cell wall biosynthesis
MSISVVIPAYNSGPLLAETLRSVLAQTLQPDEVLVIDDGSTDGTADVAESFGPPVRVFRRANARQGASRNFGVEQATSEWIAFVDHDDLWVPEKLERQMQALSANPKADLCYTARAHFDQDRGKGRWQLIIPVPPAAGIRKALFRNTTFLPSSVVIRRSTFLAAGGFNTSFRIVEDWDLWLRLLNAGVQFAACQEPLMLYRVHSQNLSRTAQVWLGETDAIYRRYILPQIGHPRRWIAYNRFRSHHQSSGAMRLRAEKSPGCVAKMARSILRDPFHNPHRFKVLAHMLLKGRAQPSGVSST